MAWPSPGNLRDKYPALLEEDSDAALQAAIDEAVDRHILPKVAIRYNVSTFGVDTPPKLFQLALVIGRACWSKGPHVGSRQSDSDKFAQDEIDKAEAQLDQIAEGTEALLDEDGDLIPSRLASSAKHVHRRSEKPVFNLGPSYGWKFLSVEGNEWK